MAFELLKLQVNRGTAFANAQGEGLTAVTHSYKSDTDTLATMAAPGYFPPNFNTNPEDIFPKDWLIMVDSTGATSFVNITSVSPVTLSADLFSSGGGGFTVVAPIAPIDNNGIVISGTNIGLEFAALNRPGILSSAAQTVSGLKTFNDDILSNSLNALTPADMLFIGATSAPGNSITIGNPLASAFIPAGVILPSVMTAAPGGLVIHANNDGHTIIGQDTASVTTGVLTNRIDPISNANPLKIGADTTNPVQLGQALVPIIVHGGVRFPSGATIDDFDQHIATFNWTTSPQGPVAGKITLNKFDNTVYMTIKPVPSAPSSAAVAFGISGIIPVNMRPPADVLDVTQVIDNSTFATGSVGIVAATGTVNVYANDQQGLFAAAGNSAIGGVTCSWDTV